MITRDIIKQLNRAANGFIKLFVFSAVCKTYSQTAYMSVAQGRSPVLNFILLAVLNALDIFFNFSGYCDIVIAFGKLAGFEIPENFDKPYLACNMVEFWNRWHITLSQWIRDYIYSPLFKFLLSSVLKKKVRTAQYLSLFVTFLMAGLWHGDNLNFIAYGVLQGLGIVLATAYKEVLTKKMGKQRFKAYSANLLVKWSERVLCISYVCFSFAFVGPDIIGIFIK